MTANRLAPLRENIVKRRRKQTKKVADPGHCAWT
jgi:hypothetical protein